MKQRFTSIFKRLVASGSQRSGATLALDTLAITWTIVQLLASIGRGRRPARCGLLAALCGLLAMGPAHAQQLPWQRADKLTGSASIFATAYDAAGDEYVAGYFSGTLGLGSLSIAAVGTSQTFVAKRSAAGTWLWARRAGTSLTNVSGINDIGYRLAVVGSGATAQVFLSGRYMTTVNSTADFGPFTLSGYAPSVATGDIFVAALDGNGTWLWARRAGSAGGHDFAPGLAVTGSGTAAQVFISGYCSVSTTVPMQFGTISLPGYSTSVGNDLFVASLDASGNWLWARRAGSTLGAAGTADEMADNLVATGTGAAARVFMLGTYYATTTVTAEFGPFTLAGYNASGSADLFVAALDASGTWLWAKRAGGPGYDFCYGAKATGSGASTRIYTTGTFTGSTTNTAAFGTTALPGYGTTAGSDAYVAALDGSGNWLWAKRMGSSAGEDNCWSVDVAGSGPSARLYIAGDYTASTATTADFGGGMLRGFGTTASADVFVAALDTAGTWLALQRAGGTGADRAFSLSVAAQGCTDRLLVGGSFGGSLTAGATTLTGTGTTAWLGVINQNFAVPTATSAGTASSVCPGVGTVLGPFLTLPGYAYNWSPATGLSSTTVANPTATLSNTTNQPVVQRYTLTTTIGGCVQTSTVDVTVLPAPDPGTIAGPAAVCVFGQPQQYSVASLAGTTYQWSVTGGTLTAGQGTNQATVQFAAGAASYGVQVQATSAAGCVGPVQRLVVQPDASSLSLQVASVAETDNTRVEVSLLATSGVAGASVRVLRRVAGAGSFAQVGTLAATAPLYTDQGLDAAANSYEYQLELTNACGTVLRSPVVQTIRLEASASPGLGGASQGAAVLRWNAYVGFAVQGYQLYRRLDGGPWQLLNTLPATTLQATVPNTSASTVGTAAGFRHEFRVVATGAAPLLSRSNTAVVEFSNPLRTYNIITPNGDQQNDRFVVDNLTLYPGNVLRIFNRWGREVFAATNYQNNWGEAADVQPGTYYYLLTLPTGPALKGWVEVVK